MKVRRGTLGTADLALRVAEGAVERMRGLLGSPLAPGEGLLIRPCNMIHTWGMREAIDVVFVSRRGVVLKLSPQVPQRRMRACLRADAVIELPAGDSARRRLVPGLALDAALIAR